MLELFAAIIIAIFSVLAVAAGAGKAAASSATSNPAGPGSSKAPAKPASAAPAPTSPAISAYRPPLVVKATATSTAANTAVSAYKPAKASGAADQHTSALKSYGLNPHLDKGSLPKVGETEQTANLLMRRGGGFDSLTGEIKAYKSGSEPHEYLHRAQTIEAVAPTKRLRKELYGEWDKNREYVKKAEETLSASGMHNTPVTQKAQLFAREVSAARALTEGAKGKDHLEQLKKLSEGYEGAKKALLSSPEYSEANEKYSAAREDVKTSVSTAANDFVNSKKFNKQLDKTLGETYGSNPKYIENAPAIKEKVRKNLSDILTSKVLNSNLPVSDVLENNNAPEDDVFGEFIKFAKKHETFQEIKKKDERIDKICLELNSMNKKITDEYEKKTTEYFRPLIHEENSKMKSEGGRINSEPKGFSPLLESFAFYRDVQGGGITKRKAKKTLVNEYGETKAEKGMHGEAFDRVYKIHEGLKKYGGLTDEQAMKAVLPISKYVRSADELKQVSTEGNIKKFAEYVKHIAPENGLTNAFGEYQGLSALGHMTKKKE